MFVFGLYIILLLFIKKIIRGITFLIISSQNSKRKLFHFFLVLIYRQYQWKNDIFIKLLPDLFVK